MFNIGDKFLIHVFKAHLTAAIIEELKMETKTTTTDHPQSLQWLEGKAELIVSHLFNLYRSSVYDAPIIVASVRRSS